MKDNQNTKIPIDTQPIDGDISMADFFEYILKVSSIDYKKEIGEGGISEYTISEIDKTCLLNLAIRQWAKYDTLLIKAIKEKTETRLN